MVKKAAIVGSGIAGLATAIRLAAQGYEVEVFEANGTLGGKVAEIVVEGFRFDTGPAVITNPQAINELYSLVGKEVEDDMKLIRLSPEAKYFFTDGTAINAYAEMINFATEIEAKTGERKENVIAYIAKSKKWTEASAPFLTTERNLSWSTLFSLDTLDVVSLLSQPSLYTSIASSTKTFKDKRVQVLFNHFASYGGANPYKAPAATNILPYLELSKGAYVPKNGIKALVDSLVKMGTDAGVKFHTNVKVDAILFDKKKTWGIGIAGEDYLYDVVISNVDIVQTSRQLMRALDEPKELQRPLSHSAMIFYWGIGKLHEQLEVKNVFFPENPEEEYRHLYDVKKNYSDPTIQVTITSKYNPADAPLGAENWMIMVNVPNNTGQDWKVLRKEVEANVLAKLSRMLGEDISKWIIADDVHDPAMLEARTNTYHGALYGSSGNSMNGVFNRHRNYHEHLAGLYFCGGTVHPGPGIANCLQSAKIVADLIKRWE